MSHGMNDSESSADSTAPLDFHRRPGEYKTVEEVLEKLGKIFFKFISYYFL
jgi:hypothetical protein